MPMEDCAACVIEEDLQPVYYINNRKLLDELTYACL